MSKQRSTNIYVNADYIISCAICDYEIIDHCWNHCPICGIELLMVTEAIEMLTNEDF
ncbi:MAG: hypothetical protein ACLKAO_03790 [Alkaliphilus sp.]